MICATCETETDVDPCTSCEHSPLLNHTYTLHSVLGRGAHGMTFLADGPHGPCAIKELHLGRTTAGKATELFVREVQVLQQLSHERIPTLHDHFVTGVGVARSLYVVQQYVPGETLEEHLTTHRFTETEVCDILTQVSDILRYLHSLSPAVVHRDVKPSNLMRSDDGTITLIDFGAVRDVMQDTVGGGSTVAGTFGYMAPEQLVGDATPQSDLYALGMTAIRLLTRQHPTSLTNRLGQVDWRSRTSVSDETAAIIDGLIHPDPLQRRPIHAEATALVRTPSPQATSRASRLADLRWANAARQVTLWERFQGVRRVHIETEIPRAATLQDAEDAALFGVHHKVFETLPTLNAHYGPSLDQHGWVIGNVLPDNPTTDDLCQPRIRLDSQGDHTRVVVSQEFRVVSSSMGGAMKLAIGLYSAAVAAFVVLLLVGLLVAQFVDADVSATATGLSTCPASVFLLVGFALVTANKWPSTPYDRAKLAKEADLATERMTYLAQALTHRITARTGARTAHTRSMEES